MSCSCPSIVENTSHEGFKRNETVWAVLRLNHQRSRYIWDRYKARDISRELYDWLIKEKYADAGLIAKWKKVTLRSCVCRNTALNESVYSKDTSRCVAYSVCKQKIQTLAPHAYVVYRESSWKMALPLNASAVAVAVVAAKTR